MDGDLHGTNGDAPLIESETRPVGKPQLVVVLMEEGRLQSTASLEGLPFVRMSATN